jgi:translation initiation factor SUI1
MIIRRSSRSLRGYVFDLQGRLGLRADDDVQQFACNGTLIEDEDMGTVIQLQGDQRAKILRFLTEQGIQKDTIKLHGF